MAKYRILRGSVKVGENSYVPPGGVLELTPAEMERMGGAAVFEPVKAEEKPTPGGEHPAPPPRSADAPAKKGGGK